MFVTPVWSAPIISEAKPRTPEEQQKLFHLPKGFKIQLVASEPAIGKPMNLSFDAKGRLWVSHSLEYPFPATGEGVQPRDLGQDMITPHAPRDRLSYFETIHDSGAGETLVHFAEGLNIPIGQIPLVVDNQEVAALGYSIPSIRLYQKAGNRGLADHITTLFTGFGNVDTHGMCNSFTRGFDGWIYACHGFRNTSNITRPNGPPLSLNSGNTIRFKPDGSVLEQFTHGQVNPFGMTFDRWGNLYNADCHSMPVTLLLRGAYYQSFGKPHDGLGFGPDMIDHNHGSTGICGIACYDAPQFPREYRDNLFICNPVNGQVHRDKLVWTGSTPKAVSQPEFITCDDEWFRPVDVKLGPDGALYIADFYNSIIGHYEAPLQHPLRDRTHARIWRVVYDQHSVPVRGDELLRHHKNEAGRFPGQSDAVLTLLLGDENFATRTLVTNLLVDRYQAPIKGLGAEPNRESFAALMETVARIAGSDQYLVNHRVHAAWVWSRLLKDPKPADLALLAKLVDDPEPMIRNHAARILGASQLPAVIAVRNGHLSKLARDPEGRVQRAAVEALSLSPANCDLKLLLEVLQKTPKEDTHLVHVLRIAVRDVLKSQPEISKDFARLPLEQQRMLAEITTAVHPAPEPLTVWLKALVLKEASNDSPIPRDEWRRWVKQTVRSSQGQTGDDLIHAIEASSGNDLGRHVENLQICLQGRQGSGVPMPASLTNWGERIILSLLQQAASSETGWSVRPLPGRTLQPDAFSLQNRPYDDQPGQVRVISSFPNGEQRTGIFQSRPFPLPERITFRLSGHNALPSQPDPKRNFIRLVDANTGEVLKTEYPPRKDPAKLIVWEFQSTTSRLVRFELVDGDDAGAYAWIAAGDFSVPGLSPESLEGGKTALALIREMKPAGLTSRLDALLSSDQASIRSLAAQGLLALAPNSRISAVLLWADDQSLPAALKDQLWQIVRTRDNESLNTLLKDLLGRASTSLQQTAADRLAVDKEGAATLLQLAANGTVTPQILQLPTLKFKFAVLGQPELVRQMEELTSNLPAADERIHALIAERKAGFDASQCSPENGKQIFVKRCGVCHQINGEGAKVGPQLDGVGIRGLDRLLEDILDPNRNVDAAFRSSAIALTDGRILTGLKRREEGTDVIFADQEGKEFRIASDDIDEMKQSPTSLMPGNLGESMPAEELADLLAWLLTQKPAGR